ncbi:hypothetical protein BDB00DRAFT_817429 [Zychaea mexicana]|uniref:uncharacterized protein n=1 Tax=Zychaea mexicana TaxID=64656 RepID=UPI0022FE8DE3|nr:uncharacterized protein BDB00DRAFT_817429 [Zychaea mexicana]KAI9494593.1 hypothetical protein BDB00DRAFT_817429 [Zychaea mexicana]
MQKPKVLKPFNRTEIKVLLLEDVNQTAIDAFQEQGYQVETFTKTFVGQELIDKVRDVQILGIRSKTKVTEEVLNEAKDLLAIGCFCIATEQVDLKAAATRGIAVYNSPFKNSHSVAELVIGEVISLARQLGDRNREMHKGIWNKVSKGCFEIRGKILGIVGYGHVGSQLSVLAEALGMRVYFYDLLQLMPLGSARQLDTLEELLAVSDFVTLHVPEQDDTKGMIGVREISLMKPGSFVINNGRGSTIQLQALVDGLRSGHLAGAALDVYPKQPTSNGPHFTDYPDLLDCPNVILTPHVAGATEEAQENIGLEVSSSLIQFVNDGISLGAVNFPQVGLRAIREDDAHTARVLHVHQNIPGVLRELNKIFTGLNVERQYSNSKGAVAYVMADVANVSAVELQALYDAISATSANIRTRIMH